MHKTLTSFLAFSAILGVADISGAWQAERTVQNGRKLEFYYVLKADGNKFTGRMVSNREQREIVNGVVEGNQITFDLATGTIPTCWKSATEA